MRKLAMVLTLVVVLVPLVGAAALAAGQIIQCRSVPCNGAGDNNKILDRIGNGKQDLILPRGGNDLILATKYNQDIDVVRGGKGWDKIKVNDGDISDTAGDGRGRNDWCFVDSRSEVGMGCDKVTIR
jgi:hypothetical protein